MKKIIIFLFLFIYSLNAQEVLDKIVAVVDDEVILQSELEFQTAMFAAQRNLNPQDSTLKNQLLEKLIEDKLLYAQAILDSIEVTDDEVDGRLDYLINYYKQQYGSQEKLEKAYGMSVDRIKREMRDDTKKNIMAEKLKQQKFGKINVTRRDVEEFFNEYKDSLGVISEKYKIAHIFINPKSGGKIKEAARKYAQTILDSIKNGADFAELAKKVSEDPGSAAEGGDLGFVKRGVFYPEFESAAFQLKKGEISKVIESPVGFHIIQMLERRGESIHTRHILIKPKSDNDADLRAIEKLTEIRDSIVNKVNTFEYYALKYSDDKQTAKFGGVLGTFEKGQLEKPLLQQITKLKEGEISFPKRLDIGNGSYGFHIVKLIKKIPQHKANLETDYDEIKKIAEFRKREKLFAKWMKEIKQNIYWEIRL